MDELREIYNSRTFCLFEDVEKLKKMGLAQGGSLDTAIVLKGNEILNKEKERNFALDYICFTIQNKYNWYLIEPKLGYHNYNLKSDIR